MTQHVLLENSRRSKHRAQPDLPENAAYDAKAGWWYYSNGGNGPPFPKPETKKNDIETGEDMKGE